MLLAINFHYIQPEDRFPYPGIFPTTADQLERQLIELGSQFEFIRGQDLVNAVLEGTSLPDKACLITFDDGLKEQYQVAAPILEELTVSGVFFICPQPIKETKALTVHKMHWLRATRSPEQFLEQILKAAKSLNLPLDLSRVDDEVADQQYLYDDPATKRIKFMLNHMIPFDSYRRLIDTLFSQEKNEGEFCREMYMSEEEIISLSRKHTVGSHSYYHCPLSDLAPEILRRNLSQSREILAAITEKPVNLISYPYGGPTAVSMTVAEAAKASGFVAGFTMERSINRSLVMPHLLARISTNDAPGGKTPLIFTREDDLELMFYKPMTGHRTVYFDELAYSDDQVMKASS
jgi:peptidoglycan/xylan/chitin deacetylase (PgdA/CDA1 family)